MAQSRPLFGFSFFSRYIFNNRNWKNVDGVLRIKTQGIMIVGADKTMEPIVS